LLLRLLPLLLLLLLLLLLMRFVMRVRAASGGCGRFALGGRRKGRAAGDPQSISLGQLTHSADQTTS